MTTPPTAVESVASEHFSVAIIGAGPTGIVAATVLARHGVDCVILDRWAGVYPRPRAVHLDDEIYRILAGLGVAAEFATISRPAAGLRLVDQQLRTLAQFDRDSFGTNGFPKANLFDQPELEAVLRTNLRRYPNAVLRGETEVTAVAAHEDRNTIRYTDHRTGITGAIAATYVLGCDGANSITRTTIGAKMIDLRFRQRWLVVDVECEVPLKAWDGVHQVCDPLRPATFMRIGATRYRWEFRLQSGETATDFADISRLAQLIGPWTRDTPLNTLTLVRCAEYTFRAQLADSWRSGNIFLLGDAAHLTPPFIGQGMGAGIRDAVNLGWKLAAVLQGGLDESALSTYEVERRPHARAMIVLAIAMGMAMSGGGRFGDVLRHLILPRLGRVPGIRATIADGVTPALRRNELVRGTALSGRLCPNSPVDGRPLDDIVGDRYAVITTERFSEKQSEHLDPALAALLHCRREGPLGRWLTGAGATLAVVRPDRTVLVAGVAEMGRPSAEEVRGVSIPPLRHQFQLFRRLRQRH